jgi:predicted SAM-dependent methyltransferase
LQATDRIGIGLRYTVNLVEVVRRQRGNVAATAVAGRFLISEAMKMPRWVRWSRQSKQYPQARQSHPTVDPDALREALATIAVPVEPFHVEVDAFREHLASNNYPRFYAGGPIDQGGWREEKVLEYVVSLDLLRIKSTDVVVDVASEWSVFPDVVRQTIGARVYRQDMIYRPGIEGDRIGGSAADMPLQDQFADVLVLHNSFEHFEGTADTDFIKEAWRVLKPGGKLCILPLFITDRHMILTDPLVDRQGIAWDPGAHVIDLPWWHNRFGRFYDVAALQCRVLQPGKSFSTTIYEIENACDVHQRAYLRFALVMQKPVA